MEVFGFCLLLLVGVGLVFWGVRSKVDFIFHFQKFSQKKIIKMFTDYLLTHIRDKLKSVKLQRFFFNKNPETFFLFVFTFLNILK